MYRVCFFGHRMIEDFALAEERTEALIQKLINEKEFVEFLIGRDGDYDQIAASCVRRVRRELQAENCALIRVMAYDRAEYRRDSDQKFKYACSAGSFFRAAARPSP